MTPNDNDPLFTQDEFRTTYLHGEVAKNTLEKWRCTGQGPRFVRVGRRIFYRRSDIEAWLTSRTVAHTQESMPSPVPPTLRRLTRTGSRLPDRQKRKKHSHAKGSTV
jgi:hypothetical protein